MSGGSATAPDAATTAYRGLRAQVLERPVGAARRRELTAVTDAWLADLFAAAGAPSRDVALVATGGYGRGELAAGSDLDVLLLYRDGALAPSDVEQLADAIWYPIWDARIRLDHSVRTIVESRRMAHRDLWVLLGLLDARTVAGDSAVTKALVASVLADWRALAATRLPDLRASVEQRLARSGECAHLLEPDVKDSYGGLRDATVLRAIAASWITDVPHDRIDAPSALLLDVRDALHTVTGRATDRLVQQEQPAVAQVLGMSDEDALLRAVSSAARSIAYASELTWHRATRLLRTSSRVRRIGPERTPLVDGVVVQDGEVVLAADARPDRDPTLVLRAAAAAAQVGLPLAPRAVDRLAVESAPMPVPWPPQARDALVSLLGAGRPALTVWEALDQAGVISHLMPEWDVVRSAPQRNPVHTFTVDRHLVEAAIAAAARARRVSRPDLLIVGALLHDIGKARPGDHTDVGVDLVARIGPHLGFDADDTDVLVDMVRFHLLLPDVATRRDLDDPATVALVADAVRTHERLELLHALTEADAAATGPAAWSEWKEALIRELVTRTHRQLAGDPRPGTPNLTATERELAGGSGVQMFIEPGAPVSVITVAAPDRVGLLATVAGVLAVHRLDVRAADTETVGDRAVTVWRVVPQYGDIPAQDLLRDDLRRALDGSLDISERLARREASRPPVDRAPPWVGFVTGASERASVLEVRAHDAPGLLYRIGTTLSAAAVSILAARVSTLGSEAVDVFYVVESDGGGLLTTERCDDVRRRVLAALTPAD